jgi:ATP-dependent helicase Lhr and Lhr-like helicase
MASCGFSPDPLSSFHPLVREWFLDRYGGPTAVQEEAWPAIASGSHVLAVAPTGSGKTLTAFLGAISRLASGQLPPEGLSVLYVSPLKALAEDVRRNLEVPLGELAALFRERGVPWPELRAATRSGDTSQADRRRMLRSPPSILATTPESLAIMLDSPSSRSMLSGVRLLVLDEIHALASDKRGAMLACSVGRLALLAGEFQRVALSATARPLDALADFVGGRELLPGSDGRPEYRRRKVLVVSPPAEKRIELSVEWPELPDSAAPSGPAGAQERGAVAAPRYAAIIPEISRKMDNARGIIVFTDSRRRAERMAFLINEAKGELSAWAHHGSLSREARRVVEERFKTGKLGCVVATASLELGIDVGSVDEVVLAGSPGSVASALQRIGRSGHGVGETSKGTLYPFHGMDLVLAAAAAKGVAERAVEVTRPLSCPLDVLAQVLLEVVAEESRSGDALYDIILSFPPFERLPRALFDSTLAMLAGKYAGTRLRELEPRVAIDEASGTVVVGPGARGILFSSGGTIPDRGMFSMRIAGSKTRIGELDEEFVWERRVGEVFTLGAQAWRIVEIGSEAVVVASAPADPDIVPFWKGEARFRSPELSSRALSLLDALAELDEAGGAAVLENGYGFSPRAASFCSRFVAAQKAAGLGRPSLPGTRLVAVEVHEEAGAKRDSVKLVLHTLRGLAINEGLAIALAAAMEEECGLPIRRIVDDNLILLSVPRAESFDPLESLKRALLRLSDGKTLDSLVRRSLEGTGVFGAQFRENAGRALLLPRGLPGKRTPLWVTRLRAKKLFDAVRSYEDFPVVVETWRSCLCDLFDREGARALASDLASGRVELSAFASRVPSPFAREALWKETGDNMYRGDELEGRVSSSVSDRVVEEALRSARLRPSLERGLVSDFEAHLKRLVPGWAPENGFELAEWVRERVLIPSSELSSILKCAEPCLESELAADPSCGGRLVRLTLPGGSEEVLVHAERERGLRSDPAAHIGEWLRREVAVSPARISALFGISGGALADALRALVENGEAVDDFAIEEAEGGAPAVIDSQNLEILLRRSRSAARPSVSARNPEDLARLVFSLQGLEPSALAPGNDGSRLSLALCALSGFAAPAALWEAELLPSRVARYRCSDLDAAFSASPWQWFGSGKGRISIASAADLELFLPRPARGSRARSALLPPEGPGLDFWGMRERSGLSSAEAARALWEEAWKGLVASDSFRDVREGLASDFGTSLPELSQEVKVEGGERESVFGSRRRIPRALRERWRRGAPLGGRWFSLDLEADGDIEEDDGFNELGLDASRVRVLASRYGLLCRSMLEREMPALRWGELFPAMRRLELAGELLSGRFFEGLEGPQFLDPSALPLFRSLDEAERRGLVWINALDPAASSLYAPSERQTALPSRLPANRLCVERGKVLAVSTRSYRELSLTLEPGDARLPEVFGLFAAARSRDASPERRIVLESVNGESASRSPFVPALRAVGFEEDRGRMVLW